MGTHFLPVGTHFTTLPGPHHLWTSSVLLIYIQFSLFSTRNTELRQNGSTGLVLADTILVTSGSVPMTRARPPSFLPNAAVILQVHGRAHLHQSGSLRDLAEQDPPADHAGHTAWERKTLSLATKMWGLFVTAEQSNLSCRYITDLKNEKNLQSTLPICFLNQIIQKSRICFKIQMQQGLNNTLKCRGCQHDRQVQTTPREEGMKTE